MMKQIILVVISFLILTNISGQNVEFGCSFNSGLFSYSGQSSVGTSFINVYGNTKTGYTNNPYGSKNGLSYGLSFNLKRITKINFLYGLDIGLESLRSMVSINEVFGYNPTVPYTSATQQTFLSATGQTFLNSNFLNFNPFIGYRLYFKKVSFDLSGGFDYGHVLSSKENGSAISTDGVKYTSSMDRKNITTDIRRRIQFSAKYKRFGLYVGYSYGLMNYLSGMMSDSNQECFARIMRFGVTYQIK